MCNNNYISIQDLHLAYGAKTVLRINDLSVDKAQLIALTGRNGSGKSTLLRCIIGLQQAQSGNVFVSNTLIHKTKPSQRSKIISFVGTRPVNVPHLTVYEVVAGGRAPYTSVFNRLSHEDKKEIKSALELLDLQDLSNRKLNQLSDGERQKCMIARAYAQNTKIMVLDEPTAFLDYPSRKELLNNLKMLSETKKKCIIFSTHDLDLSLTRAHYIWYIHEHELFSGNLDQMKENQAFNIFLQ